MTKIDNDFIFRYKFWQEFRPSRCSSSWNKCIGIRESSQYMDYSLVRLIPTKELNKAMCEIDHENLVEYFRYALKKMTCS